MTEGPDSPHLLEAQANSRLYVAIAELDAYAPAAQAAPLRAAFAEGAVDAEIEILPGVDHGFCYHQRQTYDAAAAEQLWSTLYQQSGEAMSRSEEHTSKTKSII